jgi:hypothetical protein
MREDSDTDRKAGDRLLDHQYGQEDEAIGDERQRTAPEASVTELIGMWLTSCKWSMSRYLD